MSQVAREPAEAVLALGSNLGDRTAALRAAVHDLDASDGVEVVAASQIVASDPIGGPPQPEYRNGVVVVRTTLRPRQLLALCHRVEAAHQRQRVQRWGPRTLDLDLITYAVDGVHITDDDPALRLPHPRAHQRAFVLAPWAQLQPDACLPVAAGTQGSAGTQGFAGTQGWGLVPIRRLLETAPDRQGVRLTGVQLRDRPADHEPDATVGVFSAAGPTARSADGPTVDVAGGSTADLAGGSTTGTATTSSAETNVAGGLTAGSVGTSGVPR
ncbi:MAG: 2-amino-4-hydroxy-6-hydroxymethyldihydropteridine diphosphokinase [Angustibacter sp.]